MSMHARSFGLALCATVLLLTAACAREASFPSKHGEETPSTEAEKKLSEVVESSFGRAVIHSLTEDEQKNASAEKTSESPILLPTALAFGVKSYRVGSLVSIEPKLLFRSLYAAKSTSGELFVVRGALALVDGLASHVSTGLGSVPIPAAFLIHDRPGLLNFLKKEVGAEPSFASQIPCPSQVSLSSAPGVRVGGVVAAHATCQLNTFYPVELRLSGSQWRELKASVLNPPRIDALSLFQLSPWLTVHSVELKLSRSAIRRRLEELLEKKALMTFTAAREVVARVIGEAFQSLKVPVGVPTNSVQDELIQSFFAPQECAFGGGCYAFLPLGASTAVDFEFRLRRDVPVGKPTSMMLKGPLGQGLLETQDVFVKPEAGSVLSPPKLGLLNRLSLTATDGDLLEFDFSRSERSKVEVETKVEMKHRPTCKAPYSVCRSGKWTCTSTAVEKINPRPFCQSSRQECTERCRIHESGLRTCHAIPEGSVERFDLSTKEVAPGFLSVCTAPVTICLSWGTAYDERPLCQTLPLPPLPLLPYKLGSPPPSTSNFRWDCLDAAEGVCEEKEKEDQWYRVTTYSEPHLTPTFTPAVLSETQLPQVLDGLLVGFSWGGPKGTEEVFCPFRELKHSVSPEGRILVELENTAGCRLFNDENRRPGNHPSISIHNKSFLKDEFRCGKLVEMWNGKRRYICRPPDGKWFDKFTTVKEDEERLKKKERIGLHLPFYPRLLLKGSVRVVRQNSIFGGEK